MLISLNRARHKRAASLPHSGWTQTCIALVLIASILTGCGAFPNSETPTLTSNGYELDPVFWPMYKYWGGVDRFGQPISPVKIDGEVKTQFVEGCEMVFDNTKPKSEKYSFSPLGTKMVLEEQAVRRPKNPDIPFVDGHTTLPEFYALYEKLGPSLVGRPLTEPRHNLIRSRTEQFFENLGFYKIDGTDEVHLLAYGAWGCQGDCLSKKKGDPAIIDIQSYIDPIFRSFVDEVGADFTGFALTDLYLTQEGVWEQILENVVLQTDSRENPTHIGLRPIVRELSIQGDDPRPSEHLQGAFFYVTRGEDKGYDILFPYWNYLSAKGKDRIELTGVPISHDSKFMGQTYHQCFENVCLQYDPTAAEAARVRPEPLGYGYKTAFYPARAVQIAKPTNTNPLFSVTATPPQEKPRQPPKRAVSLRVWESYQTLEKKQNQQIQVWVLDNNQPVVNGIVRLTVSLPNSGDSEFEMPPTDTNGQSSLTLPKIKAANGVIIPYSACYVLNDELDVCVKDSFVIWDP